VSDNLAAESAARAALGAALKPYRKFSQGPGGTAVRLRLMCDTVASFDARHFWDVRLAGEQVIMRSWLP
jgi:hypothetical protein